MLSCSWTSGPTADFVRIQQSTHTSNSRTIKYNKRVHARVPLSPRPTVPASQFPLARLSSWKSSLKIAHSKRGGVKTTRNLLVAFSLEPSVSQALLNGRAMKIGFRAVSFPAVTITCWAVIWTRKTPNKGLPGNNQISNFSHKLSICNTSGWRAKQYARHQLSRDVDHVPSCIVFLGRF